MSEKTVSKRRGQVRVLSILAVAAAVAATPLLIGAVAPASFDAHDRRTAAAKAEASAGIPGPGGAVERGPNASSGFWSSGDSGSIAESLLESMSDEEVIGQLFMLAYPGDTPPELLFDWIEKRGLGGVKIFGWNAEDTGKLAAAVASLQKAALASKRGIPILVATDQEGGWIRHVKGATTQTPGNMSIGASGIPYDAYRSANLIARELLALGITMNFAPNVDLATRPRNPVIGPRAFGESPMESAVLGAAYARGTEDAGVIPTAKHFPGHGDTDLDSHGVLPVIRRSEAGLWERELVPFRLLSAEGVPAIMSAHLNFPLVTGDGLPASLSRKFMTGILRERIGFKGVAVTDDLFMAGAAGDSGLAFSEVCSRAIEAGNDLLMASRILALDDPAWRRLLAAYRTKPAFRERAREAAKRVLVLKLDRLKPLGEAKLVPDETKLAERIPEPEAAEYFKAQAFRGVSSPDARALPFKPEGRMLIAAPMNDFIEAGRERYPGAESFRFSYRPEAAALASELEAFSRALSRVDAVLLCVANEAGMDFADRARARGKKIGIVSLLSPAPLRRLGKGEAAVAVYGSSRYVFSAGLDALSGSVPAPGRIPMTLER